MDFHAAVETFAEAWVAANTHPASERQTSNQMELEEIQTQLPREPHLVTKTSPMKHVQPPLSSPSLSSSTSPLALSPSSSCTRSLPIHCIVEQTNGSTSFDNLSTEKSTHSTVELDSYAILPGTTLLTECVRAALLKLGYNSTEAIGAKGAVQVKNWRPLDFETITDNKSATIDDMLGELTQVATLRIRICRQTVVENFSLEPYEWNDEFVRWTVLDLLRVMNQSTLAKLSPLSQSMISNIVNSKYPSSLSSDKLRAFGTWYKEYKSSQQYNEHRKQGQSKDSANIRMTFHPNIEVPKLKAWFQEHPLPSDNLLSTYVNDLNKSLVRLERPKVEIKHLKQWWTNQKQKIKREEREKSLEARNCDGQENDQQSKKRMKVLPQSSKSKSEKKLKNNQKRENEVRNIEGQGVVCEMNISETLQGRNLRKNVLGNCTRNTSRDTCSSVYMPIAGNPEHRVDHHSVFISPVSQPIPIHSSKDIEQTHHMQISNRSLDSGRELEKGPGYQFHGASNVRGMNLQGDSHYQPL